MKLYWGKHTCAIGIHVILEEIGRPYELVELDIAGGEHQRAPFTDLNPKAKVPTLLRGEGGVLTEYAAIASWLADLNRDAGLLPFHAEEPKTRLYEAMDYLVGTIHGQAFHRIFKPGDYVEADADDAAKELVRTNGRRMAERGFAILGEALGDKPYVIGDQFTIADTAFFYAERWAPKSGVALPENIQAHLDRMKARPSVAKVMQVWGEA